MEGHREAVTETDFEKTNTVTDIVVKAARWTGYIRV